MNQEIPGTLLLDPKVIEDPYPFYRQLHRYAPVWRVPGTEVFVASSFALLAEAVGRVDDFSSNMHCFLYRDENGLPSRLPFGRPGIQTLATADPPIHTLHRGTVFPNFVSKRMASLEPDVVDLATDCVGRALSKRNVDFMHRSFLELVAIGSPPGGIDSALPAPRVFPFWASRRGRD